MRFVLPFVICVSAISTSLLAAKPGKQFKQDKRNKPNSVTVLMREGLRFDPPRFSAEPGAEIVINLRNEDSTDQMHNFVLLKPGKLQDIVNQALMLGEKGPALSYVPQSPDIITHSELLGPEKKTALRITLPSQPGVYPYVCSFPGHGLVMYGAAYVGVPMPPLEKDKNIPAIAAQTFIAGNGKRPYVQRIFMPDCGPAAIAVALPGELNACWDAGQCRLRYVWSGPFINATKHWAGNGKELAVLGGTPWWRDGGDQLPISVGENNQAAPAVQFLGYRLEKGLPIFRYKVNGVEVTEKLLATPDGKGVLVNYHLTDASKFLSYKGEVKGTDFTLTLSPAAK